MRQSAHKFLQKVLGEAGVRVASSLFIILLANYLGAENFGRYSSALAYAALCIVFVDLGTNAILVREMARHPEERHGIASSSHSLKLIASVAAWSILLSVTYVLHFTREDRYLTLCLGIVVIGQTLTEYFSALLNGVEEMGWEALLKTGGRFLALLPGFMALAMHQSLSMIVSALALGTLAGYALCVGVVRYRFKSFGVRFDKDFTKTLLLSSWPLFGSVVFLILYDSQDILLLNYFHFAQREIGLFSAAMKIIDVFKVYPVLMLGVFFPTLSKLHLSDPAAFLKKQRRLLLFMAGSSTLLAFALYVLSPWIIHVIYKSDFSSAAHLLRLLLPALIGLGINHTQTQILISLNQERKLLLAAVIACGFNLLMGFFLLPRFGLPGICYALWGSEILYFLFLRQVTAMELSNDFFA